MALCLPGLIFIHLGAPTHILRHKVFVATSGSTSTQTCFASIFDYQPAIFPYYSSAPPGFIRREQIYLQVLEIMT